jgi:FAD/FMN-containing dehydrogenase
MSTFPSLQNLTSLSNFGRSISAPAYLYRPTSAGQIAELFRRAEQTGYTIGLRGAGRSYGDAALNSGQVVLDLRRFNRILEWNPQTGVIRVEPGVTIQQLWQITLEDGWWPPVVPGTQFPTLGGCLGMNIHGKNNYHMGPIGEHVLAFTALLPTGEEITCAPAQNADLFYSLISSAGTLGVFTSITLQLKRLYSGLLDVEAWTAPNLRAAFNDIEAHKDEDYIVGWVDSIAGGAALGRAELHRAAYLPAGADPDASRTLTPDYQTLPDTFLGLLPKSAMWRFMAPFFNNLGMGVVNFGKYLVARFQNHHHYRQSLIAFNFLFDYVPNWERAYGPRGLIQYQAFIPRATAPDAFTALLQLAQKRGLPNYLSVIKRHRPDNFLFTHAVEGYSMAMDYRVPRDVLALQRLANDLNCLVLDAGGRFYFAKDSTLTPEAATRFLGEETLARFRALKTRCDPHAILQTDLYRRLLRDSTTPSVTPPPVADVLFANRTPIQK